MNERPHISASQIQVWSDCRLKHFYSRQDRALQTALDKQDQGGSLAMQVGSFVHTILADWLMLSVIERDEDIMGLLFLGRAGDTQVKEKAKLVVRKYWRTFGADEGCVPMWTEFPITLPLTERTDLVCILDAVAVDDVAKTVTIWEHKTSLSKANVDNKAWYSIQPQCYRMAAEYCWPGYTVSKVVYTVLTPTSAVRMERPLFDDGAYWDAHIRQIALEMETLPIRASYGPHCAWCDFQGLCDRALKTGMMAPQTLDGWLRTDGAGGEGGDTEDLTGEL